MNRIKMSALAPEQDFSTSNLVGVNTFSPPRKPVRPVIQDEYSYFAPLHYEKNYAYPLVVWLHADGSNATQLHPVMTELSLRNYVGVGVRSSLGNPSTGYFWDQHWDTIDLAYKAVNSAVDEASKRFHVNRNRIFLAGSGSGGTMAFRLAFSRPDLFAGIISLNGQLPQEESPLREWERCRNIPIFWAHDNSSEQFSQTELCTQLRLLYVAGFKVKLSQYRTIKLPCSVVLGDVNHWIMETIQSAIH